MEPLWTFTGDEFIYWLEEATNMKMNNTWTGVRPIFSLVENRKSKKKIPKKYRVHILGLAHTKTNKEYLHCAFTQKVYKMCQMLTDLGYEVYHYGAEGSNPTCTENVVVLDDKFQKTLYPKLTFSFNQYDEVYQEFNRNTIDEINKRKKAQDLLACTNGIAHKPIADAVGLLAFESGIGYYGVFAKHRVYESYAWMHYIYGRQYVDNGKFYDAVIPNYFDPDDFEYSNDKGDYYVYLGRIIPRKGVDIAVEATKQLNSRLVVAGLGSLENLNLNQPHVEYRGIVGVKERSDLLKHAKALFVPTKYIEPFGGVAIEANFCGTPVITTDFGSFTETVVHGVTGYRCHTLDDFIWAAQNVDKISPEACRNWAVSNYSMNRVKWMYHEYITKLLDLYGKGWYELHPERKELHWLTKT